MDYGFSIVFFSATIAIHRSSESRVAAQPQRDTFQSSCAVAHATHTDKPIFFFINCTAYWSPSKSYNSTE